MFVQNHAGVEWGWGVLRKKDSKGESFGESIYNLLMIIFECVYNNNNNGHFYGA